METKGTSQLVLRHKPDGLSQAINTDASEQTTSLYFFLYWKKKISDVKNTLKVSYNSPNTRRQKLFQDNKAKEAVLHLD